MNPRRATIVLGFLALVLNAQVVREHDSAPLKHWAAPLYWQPTTSAVETYAIAAASATNLPVGANPLVFVAMTPCRVVDMLTLRVHLDPVSETNAPLLIAPGSHDRGRIPVSDIPGVVSQCGVVSCLAEAGDIWLYATPILHASDTAVEPQHRRVLQVDYAVGQLPGGLQWLGI